MSQPSDAAPSFTIRQYEPQDHVQVAKLIGDGLLHYAHEGEPHFDFWKSYVQKALTTDVADIPGQYLTPGSTFFVVTTTTTTKKSPCNGPIALTDDQDVSQPTIIVATLAILKKSETVAELKRVSVKREFRRFGIGRMLLHHVFVWAKNQEYDTLILSCTATQYQAIEFYESLGFVCTKRTVRLVDPYLELTHFEKNVV